MLLSRFIKSDKISTKKTKTKQKKPKKKRTNKKSQQEVATSTSNNYLLLNDFVFNFHDVKRNLILHEMVYINGKDSWLESIF